MKTCIITACTGKYQAHLRSIDHLNVDGFVFGDIGDEHLQLDGTRWTRIKEQYYEHDNAFTKAKYYKCFWQHIPILKKYDVVVWIDATIQIKTLPLHYLQDHDIVVTDHGVRARTHDEIRVSIPIKKSNRCAFNKYEKWRGGLQMQLKQPNIDWLSITCYIIHKRNKAVCEMQNIWFHDILKYSPQDQVSFPIACTQANVKVKHLPCAPPGGMGVETPEWIKHNHHLPPAVYNRSFI